ncbi:mTERF domain-containing protein [Cephalotus follicularis]|uniref:mTERF domain-containing protein n=1 Tax=Cephalotus follicularis TaxID=3775 RepID=A0A1Q3BZ18_CEPFO|nr:mTERF domain-containing protein [Cephalotus follicularis]
MVAAQTHSFPSSSTSTPFPSPRTPASLTPFANPYTHDCSSLINFTKSSISFRSFKKHVLIQCSGPNSPSELGNPFSEANSQTPCKLFSFFQEIGLGDKETESLVAKVPALRSTSLVSLRDRIHSLQSVGIQGIALYRLVTKRASVLTCEEVDPLMSFVRDELEGKIEAVQLERLLSATEPRFLVGFDQKVRLLLHLGIPGEKIAHVLNNVNLTKVICLRSVEYIEGTFTFLDPFSGIDLILRRPVILNYDLETQLIPRVTFLKELSGGDEDATGTVLRKLPAILSYSLEHVKGHVHLLRSFAGLSDEQIFKILLVFPNVISASRERKLLPRINFLKECGLDSSDVFKFLIKAPLFLGLSFEDNLVHKLGFLVKIGYRYRTKEFAVAVGAVTRTSCQNMQRVIELFMSYGLSSGDIHAMSKKHPQILQYNHTSLEEKMEYLIGEMGREVGELLAFPAFLGYRLDDRIKHRYEEKKKTLGEGMSLNKLLSVSTERFSSRKTKKRSCVNYL